jgi:hypothetical protein
MTGFCCTTGSADICAITSSSDASASGLGDRLLYLHAELNLVLFLPFPRTVPSSSANGSNSKRDPYDVLARLVKAGEEYSSSSFDSVENSPDVPFIID